LPLTGYAPVVQRITPYLLYEDCAGALDWLSKAFGEDHLWSFTQRVRDVPPEERGATTPG
jgi:uncharacterized glyoxalase superfamily protein PhnB